MSEARIEQFKKMAEADPENELGHFSLGRAYLEAGKYSDAAASLERAITLNANLSKAYQLLAETLLKMDLRDPAIARLTQGVKIANERGDVLPRNEMTQRLKDLGAPVPDFGTAQAKTEANTGMTLVVAVGYGGQWDIVQAAQRLATRGEPIDAQRLERELVTAQWPAPDLLIRTGGEYRISNFMLWQLAYTELYFTDVLWPDADMPLLRDALAWYAGRERRYGAVPQTQT